MHIPIRIDYGVRALVDLVEYGEDGPVRAADIAKRTLIPEAFLAQVLHALSKRGLIRSQRGPQGGHSFAVDPSEVRLSMVAEYLGGMESIVGCLDDSSQCIHVPACAQREVWQTVADAIYNILDSTTIADLVERTRVIAAARRSGSSSELLDVATAR